MIAGFSVFINKNLRTRFETASATLISSTFGFLFALLAAFLLAVPVDPICLSEALPFLVITIGFDKPFLLARAVFTNPQIKPVAAPYPPKISDLREERDAVDEAIKTVENGHSPVFSKAMNGNGNATSNGNALELDLQALHRGLAAHERIQREIAANKNRGIRWAAPVAASQLVMDAVQSVGPGIIRDFAIEVAVLCAGAASGIGGLREFCYLGACERFDLDPSLRGLTTSSTTAALILVMDCVCLFTFYVAILSVMVEVRLFDALFPARTRSLTAHALVSGLPDQDRSQVGSEQEAEFPVVTDELSLADFYGFHPLFRRFGSCFLGELRSCRCQVVEEEGQWVRGDQVDHL
jgi:hydroxymethylglutaryl-CoA reductase (NADPH)